MASSSRSASGVPLREQAREIVYNVHTYFQTLKETHNLKDANINNMTSEATAVSYGTDRGELKVTMEREASIYCFFLSVEKSCDAYLVLKLYLSPENSTDMKELDIDNDRLNEILSNYDDCLVKFFKSYAWTMIISVVLILAGIYEMFGIYKESRKHIFVWMLAVGLVISILIFYFICRLKQGVQILEKYMCLKYIIIKRFFEIFMLICFYIVNCCYYRSLHRRIKEMMPK